MPEAPAPPLLERSRTRLPAPTELHPSPATRLELAAVRRAVNRERSGYVAQHRCECARPSCRDTFPAAAEAHRGTDDRFIVAPTHVDGGMAVVRAADRFFVVELNDAARESARARPADVLN